MQLKVTRLRRRGFTNRWAALTAGIWDPLEESFSVPFDTTAGELIFEK
jgi:hypothetical protein